VVAGARANRAFLGRVVRYLAAEAGIRQFLDIGAGLPAVDNTHEVAQAVARECRVDRGRDASEVPQSGPFPASPLPNRT
jgi:hypothetical protein